jgi:hypothetical protein
VPFTVAPDLVLKFTIRKLGHVLADGAGFLLYVGTNESVRRWTNAKVTQITVERLQNEAEEARLAAMASGQISADGRGDQGERYFVWQADRAPRDWRAWRV